MQTLDGHMAYSVLPLQLPPWKARQPTPVCGKPLVCLKAFLHVLVHVIACGKPVNDENTQEVHVDIDTLLGCSSRCDN